MRLNLGSCDRAFPGYTSVDLCPPAEIMADLAGPWPWETSSVEAIRAYDIIEHIGDCSHMGDQWCADCAGHRHGMPFGQRCRHRLGHIHVMNEAWRVLKPGGVFDIEVPSTRGAGGFCDPTHRTFWNASSFEYFQVGNAAHTRFQKHYGIEAAFNIASLSQSSYRTPYDEVWKVKVLLEAVK